MDKGATRLPLATLAAEPDLRELSDQLRSAGLLERRPLRAWARSVAAVALLGAGWAGFFLIGDSWWQVAVAAYLAVMFTQVGFIGHDIGHRQVSGSRSVNDVIGLLHADLLIGMSYGYWVDKHNRHHANPNQLGRDPDVGRGAISWSPEQIGHGYWWRGLARWQGVLFFPMLLLEGANLHVASVRALARPSLRHRRLEGVLLAVHATAYLAAVLIVLSPARALVFVLVQQGLFGLYLGCSFAPNHKGMPLLGPDEHLSFVRRQVVTARNVKGGRLTDVALGGLNYQIEHHLFPAMPRSSLRRAQPLVRAFCEQHQLGYTECSLRASYRQTVRYLHQVTRGTGSAAPDQPAC